MRIGMFACCIILLAACNYETEKPIAVSTVPGKDSKYAGILAKCKAININDTVQVHFDESINDTFGVADTYQFTGIELDSAEATLFPTEVASGPMNYFSGINACYAFGIDSNYTGIIVRTPSMNEESGSIKLFTLDKVRDTLTHFIELADRWDKDAEWSETVSWLYRDDKMKLLAYIWARTVYEHDLTNENDTTTDEYNSCYLVDLSKPKYDTINSNAGNLLKTFQAVTGRQAGLK